MKDDRSLKEFERFFKPGFLDWLSLNWHVYREFEQQAHRIIARGRTHYSARTIVEVMVHESIIREVDGEYKIGNDRSPDLARVFAIRNPGYERFWEYRRPDWQMFLAALRVLEADEVAALCRVHPDFLNLPLEDRSVVRNALQGNANQHKARLYDIYRRLYK